MTRISKKYYFVVFIFLAIGFAAGPTIEIDETITTTSIPANIESYIKDTESRLPDIRPGAEKQLIWANPDNPAKTPLALVYLHGFAATRQEIAPVSDMVATNLGANLYYTRLTGHGRNSEAMAEITVNALLNDAVEAMQIGASIGDKVILVGTSTGATLASWLASYDKKHTIAALVLLSPNFGPKRIESELLLLPWGNKLLKMIQGPHYQFDAINELHEQFWTTRFPSKALLPMMGVVKITRDKDLSKVQQPVLIMYSPNDNIVSADKIKHHYSRFGSKIKQLIPITHTADPQNHVLAGRILSPQTTEEVTNRIVDFIKKIDTASN